MAQPTQCNGGGWAADKLVGSLGRTPTTSQKRLRGKNDKSCHNRWYKKAIDVHSERGETTNRKNREIERKEEKTE